MKFEVRLTKTDLLSAVVTVEAASEREAEERAEAILDAGRVDWEFDDTTEEVFSVDRA